MTDPMSEGSKAVAEVAKTVGVALDVVRDFGLWLDGTLGEPLRQAIGWALTDNIAQARAENQIRRSARLRVLAHETQQRLLIMGVDTLEEVPDSILEPLIAAAAREDDSTLQQLWAALLASNLTAGVQRERSFISILGEMTAEDAVTFAAWWRYSAGWRSREMRTFRSPPLTCRKLHRLGLIEPARNRLVLPTDLHRSGISGSGHVHLEEVQLYGNLDRIVVTETGHVFGEQVGIDRFAPATRDTNLED